ncbi:MAG: VOC family protein [Bdellovibrionota bacterium]
MTLNHIHLGTKDLAASRRFYERYFGFEHKFDHDPGIFLENAAGFLIAIDPVDEVPKLPSWYHLGFCLDSNDKVQTLYRSMKSDGVSIVRDMMTAPGQFSSFFVTDPDGNKIEISWHDEGST